MPRRKLWNRRFVFLLLTQAGFGFAHSAFMMLPKWMATELDAGPDAIGGVVAVSAAGIVLFLMPAGAMVDRYGRKGFLAAGAALMSVTSACFVNVESIGASLYALRILQSIAFAYAFAGGAALCVDAAPPDRIGQAVGLFGLSYVVMGAFAPAAVEEIVAGASWDAAFLLAAGTAAGCALGALLLHEEPLASTASEPVALREIIVRREMRWAMVIVALLGMAFGCAMNFHQPYALDLGLTRLRDFFIANSLAAAACRLILGPFMDRIGLRRVAVTSLTAYAGVMLSLVWLDRIGLAPIGFGMGLAHGLFYPAYTGVILADCPAHERGRRMSIVQAGLNGGMGAGGLFLGWLAARQGYPTIFVVSATAVLLGAFLITRTVPAKPVVASDGLAAGTEAA